MEDVKQGKYVTVIISDDSSTQSGLVTPRWTKVQMLNAAEKIRARLAVPNSAEIHEAEKVAAKVAEEAVERFEGSGSPSGSRQYFVENRVRS